MAAVMLFNTIMAHNTTNINATDDADADDLKPTILHDFLGRPCAPVVTAASSPSPSVSRAAAPLSTTSDLPSERQAGTHLEGVPFFAQIGDFSASKIRYSGSKRSISDSVFMAPSREGIPQMRPEFPETSHLMKMLRNVGAERPRWPHEEEPFTGMHQMRPTSSSSSLMVQPATAVKTDANASKWERAIPVNVGPVLQYPPRAGQVVPYGYQQVSNRFKDANMGTLVISQSAADEGSRTGIKGSGILSSVNVSGGVAEPSSSKHKSPITISNSEPGSSAPLHRQGSAPASRQMTIFYGGQAHVFDDVHPNKAEVIMALAGSNGGSWSTSFSPNSAVKPSVGEVIPVSGENDTIMAAKTALLSKDRMLMLSGGQGNISMKDARGPMQAGAEQKSEEKQ